MNSQEKYCWDYRSGYSGRVPAELKPLCAFLSKCYFFVLAAAQEGLVEDGLVAVIRSGVVQCSLCTRLARSWNTVAGVCAHVLGIADIGRYVYELGRRYQSLRGCGYNFTVSMELGFPGSRGGSTLVWPVPEGALSGERDTLRGGSLGWTGY